MQSFRGLCKPAKEPAFRVHSVGSCLISHQMHGDISGTMAYKIYELLVHKVMWTKDLLDSLDKRKLGHRGRGGMSPWILRLGFPGSGFCNLI